MVGMTIMYLVHKDYQKKNLLPEDMPHAEYIQNLVDSWREGPPRIERIKARKEEAAKQGKQYYPRSKHSDTSITQDNLNKIDDPHRTKSE